MKRVLLVAGPFLVTLAAALWLFGVFSRDESRRDATVEAPPPETPGPSTAELAAEEPLVEPKPDVPTLPGTVRVLALAETVRSFPQWCFQQWEHSHRIEWQLWYAHPTVAVADADTTTPGLTPLGRAPNGADLEGVQVLFLAGIDPASVSAEFWSRAAERVRDGRLGLLLLPDHLTGEALAVEASLQTVLPVAKVAPLAPLERGGTLIPGVFDVPHPFAVTPDGTKHPASRIVAFPGWSERIWRRLTTGKTAWSTKFVSPVQQVAPGARTLVEIDAGTVRYPAVVASSPERGRALWVGGFMDLDWEVMRSAETAGAAQFRALVTSWIAWLAPPRS